MADKSSKRGGTLGRHLNTIIDHRLQKLLQSVKDSYVARSVDTVHDLRVASRRLRAFGATFSDGLGQKTRWRLENKLKRLTKTVAELRDLDVLVALVEERCSRATSHLERASLEHLVETLEERRLLAAARAETRLQKLDLDAVSALVRSAARDVIAGLLPDERQPAYARAMLERLIGEAAEQEPPRDGAENAEQLHCLRIALKKLRYALEFLEPLLGAHYGILYARAEALQELLGTHHDLMVLGEVVVERRDELARKNRHALSAGLQLAGVALMAERQAALERFRGSGFEYDWWRTELSVALEAV